MPAAQADTAGAFWLNSRLPLTASRSAQRLLRLRVLSMRVEASLPLRSGPAELSPYLAADPD